jgi:hypothetical protein
MFSFPLLLNNHGNARFRIPRIYYIVMRFGLRYSILRGICGCKRSLSRFLD